MDYGWHLALQVSLKNMRGVVSWLWNEGMNELWLGLGPGLQAHLLHIHSTL